MTLPKKSPNSTAALPLAPVRLDGAHRVAKRNGTGTHIYWYAWRGGPQIAHFHGADDQLAAAKEKAGAQQIAGIWADTAYPRAAPSTTARLIADFRASVEFEGLAPSTQKLWRPALDDIDDVFGALSIKTLQARGIRARFKAWHQAMAATPRKANTYLTVLVRLLQWAIDEERLERNPAYGMAHLPEGKGRAHIIWTDAELAAMKLAAGPAMARNITILAETGLRREDFVQLTWEEVDFVAGHIRRPTNKSLGRRTACPPITTALRKALEACPRICDRVVIGELGRPYKDGSAFYNSFKLVRDRAKLTDCGKTLHDLRGTCITKGYADGASDEDMEVRMGWAPGEGGRMRAIYGSPEHLARAAAERAKS